MNTLDITQLSYLTGFNNEHETEALEGALPIAQFNPQQCKYGLYAEQFNTTAFTAPRSENRRSWLYRIRPAISMGDFTPIDKGDICTAPLTNTACPPNVMRWDALSIPHTPTNFIQGLCTMAVNGDAKTQTGMGIHVYTANTGMDNHYFYNADGELLLVPQLGTLIAYTEFGILSAKPGEICVIPRGVRFKIELADDCIRGYVCENYGAALTLAERGPVGANGYANQRDFKYPVAWFEDKDIACTLITKFCGELYQAELGHSPLDVVAWVGNSAPYKYNLADFNVINTVSFDHPDPSIFTVLTSPSDTQGVANIDFVIFPPRWMVAENTFRPPWYHRNIMSEFMGLIEGTYDAKEKGFAPGGMSLHNCMTPHGPEAEIFEKASSGDLKPQKYENSLAFMFESRYVIAPTEFAQSTEHKQKDYLSCWGTLTKHFTGNR
jgi:homogentisate 1,2-dioxygenase